MKKIIKKHISLHPQGLLEVYLAPLLVEIVVSLVGLVTIPFLDITILVARVEDRRLDIFISIGPLLGT